MSVYGTDNTRVLKIFDDDEQIHYNMLEDAVLKRRGENIIGRCSELCDVYRNSRSSPLWRWALFFDR